MNWGGDDHVHHQKKRTKYKIQKKNIVSLLPCDFLCPLPLCSLIILQIFSDMQTWVNLPPGGLTPICHLGTLLMWKGLHCLARLGPDLTLPGAWNLSILCWLTWPKKRISACLPHASHVLPGHLLPATSWLVLLHVVLFISSHFYAQEPYTIGASGNFHEL